MKREDVTKIFPEATEEQVSAVLNAIGGEINPLKANVTKLTNQLITANDGLAASQASEAGLNAKVAELTKQLEGHMSEEERIAAREKAAADREREFALKSAELEARAVFVAAGFSPEDVEALLPRVISEDAEASKAAAQTLVEFDARRRKAVEDETKDALLKGNPRAEGNEGKGTLTKEDFLKLSYSEQVQMRAENPDILGQLT